MRLTDKFVCIACDFSTDFSSVYDRHLVTKKHFKNSKKSKKQQEKYVCTCCDFFTFKKSNFDRHILTLKHKNQLFFSESQKKKSQKKQEISEKNGENIGENIEENNPKNEKFYICDCGKKYKYRQGLYTHRKKCRFKSEENTDEEIDRNKELEKQLEDINNQMKETNKQMEIYKDIIQNQVIPNMQQSAITNINNNTTTNNNFNLNIFLNETCKDAINITEFIENLKVGLQELEFVKDNGIVKGISNVFVNELNALDVEKRPIHCTDAKRKTLYIKDDNKWDKENKMTNEKIDRSIQHVKKKHIDSIKEWEEQHPNWCDDEKLAMEYLRMVRNSTTPIDKIGEKRIISEVAAEVDITEIKNKGGE